MDLNHKGQRRHITATTRATKSESGDMKTAIGELRYVYIFHLYLFFAITSRQ
jgi:hypothetical protein